MDQNAVTRVVDFIFSDRHLKLTILPTEKCNFRCEYCYEDFAHGKMSTDIVNGIKNLIKSRAPTLEFLEISWFGGEPLLASEIVLDISKFAKDIAESWDGLHFSSGATTNGYLLTVPMMEQLVMSGVTAFQVSLDGPKEFHDKTRKLANNTGSYDLLMHNLIELRNSNLSFKIVLRVHITPSNISGMPKFASELSSTFNDSRFSIKFQAIEHLGGPNDTSFEVIKENKSETIDQLYSIISGPAQKVKSKKTDNGHICYASRANAFVIRSTGSIGKCTVALNDDRNAVGLILPDGRVQLEAEKIRPWIRGVENLDFAVLGCPAAGFLHQA